MPKVVFPEHQKWVVWPVQMSQAATLNKSYAKGSVSGSSATGVVWQVPILASVTFCFYDSETTDQNDTGKGTPKTTVEMKTLVHFYGF